MSPACLSTALLAGLLNAAPAEPAGATLYRQYCASCHGTDGSGNGPAAPALKTTPPDLRATRLNEKELIAVIDGDRQTAAHGSREMPVWGVIFDKELADAPYGTQVRLLRAQVLADYVLHLRR